jgi:predicted outer membrane repeat protein
MKELYSMQQITSPVLQKRFLLVLWTAALLALALPASPAHAGGVVSVCDESHLTAALSGGGTVTFTCSGTITLTGTITIAADTTIDGSGQTVTISGNHAVTPFSVADGVALTLNQLTLADGKTTDCCGGAILDLGRSLTVTNCTFTGNSSTTYGGAIFSRNSLSVSNSTFSANSSTDGGAILASELTLTDSSFSGNHAVRGGAIDSYGQATVSGSSLTGNRALYGGALAVDSSAMLSVSDSTFSGNSAEKEGAGIANYGWLLVENSTLKGNTSVSLGGAIANFGRFTVVNSTLYANSASSSGGALYSKGSLSQVINSTFANNSSDGGAVLVDEGQGLVFENTIVAYSNTPAGPPCQGSLYDAGMNLHFSTSGTDNCPGLYLDPLLGPLQSNGGPTETMGLRIGSPAQDAGDDFTCSATPVNSRDQRGIARPIGAHCDVGAVEQQAPGYVQISGGQFHTCALRTDGSVDCWGANGYDQATDKVGPFVEVGAGDMYSLGLKDNGRIEVWGSENYEMAYGPYKQVAAGYLHSCALRSDGSIQCWGSNFFGEADSQSGSYVQVTVGEDHSCALRSNGGAYCWGNQAYKLTGDRPGPFKYISAGGYHVCAVKVSDGSVECWGANGYGQSEPPSGAFVAIAGGGYHTCGIRVDGTLACWGYNFYGQRKPPPGQYKQIGSGAGHSCAISTTNEAVCWGRNDRGQANVPAIGGPGAGVGFDFEGFYSPVKADPTLNVVKAGSSVPLKFSLGGDRGLNVLAVGSPASGPLDCAGLEPGGDLAPANGAGGSALTYDPVADQYAWAWKTDKTWAGTCRVLSLQLSDGTEHRAAFQFK